jgi:hypothetical protein
VAQQWAAGGSVRSLPWVASWHVGFLGKSASARVRWEVDAEDERRAAGVSTSSRVKQDQRAQVLLGASRWRRVRGGPDQWPSSPFLWGVSDGGIGSGACSSGRRCCMLTLPPSVRIYVAAQPVDARKSFDGLVALVETEFGLEPLLCGASEYVTGRRGRRQLRGVVPMRCSSARHIEFTDFQVSAGLSPLGGSVQTGSKKPRSIRVTFASFQRQLRHSGGLWTLVRARATPGS